MDIVDIPTSPLPASGREPLLLVIDEREERRVWVVRLLTFASYRTYATMTSLDVALWYGRHTVVPAAILLGQVNSLEHFFVRRLRDQMSMQGGKEIPIVLLSIYLPEVLPGNVAALSPASPGYACFTLLEALWHVVPRLG